MQHLLQSIAKLESIKEQDATAVITLSDLKDKQIKVDDFFKGQDHIKITNTLETSLRMFVYP